MQFFRNIKWKKIKEFILNHKPQFIVGAAVFTIFIICIIIIAVINMSSVKNDNRGTDSKQGIEAVTSKDPTIGADDASDPQAKNNAAGESDGQEVQFSSNLIDGASGSGYSIGIDVSKWQGKIDWSSVASSGIEFAVIRVGYRTDDRGTICEDPYAAYNLQKAQAAGIKIGVYFFSTAVSEDEAVEEAIWTANFIAKYSITYPVVYNCEGYTASDSRMHGLSNTKRSNNATAFLSTIKSYGYDGMLYGSQNELENNRYWNTSTIASSYSIWVASYGNGIYPDVRRPEYTGMCNMWQYTDKGIVNGISGYVDLNVAYFSYDSIASPKDTSGTVADADTAELGMTFSDVNDSMTAKEETNLRLEPNTSSTIVATIKNGEYVARSGISDSGWSRVIYNGQTAYAYTQLLTTETTTQAPTSVEDGIAFSSVNESVTAVDETNLRTAPSYDGSVVVSISNGTIVTRTGVGDNGWSRIVYNGQTLYAVTSYLTTNTEPTESSGSSTTVVNGMTFTASSGSVTAKEETNLRTAPTTEGSTIVATIKNGEYVQVTAISDSGWSQLSYNGQTVYAITSYLQ